MLSVDCGPQELWSWRKKGARIIGNRILEIKIFAIFCLVLERKSLLENTHFLPQAKKCKMRCTTEQDISLVTWSNDIIQSGN